MKKPRTRLTIARQTLRPLSLVATAAVHGGGHTQNNSCTEDCEPIDTHPTQTHQSLMTGEDSLETDPHSRAC
jgi:hypothetical protein